MQHMANVLALTRGHPVGVSQPLAHASDWDEYLGVLGGMSLVSVGSTTYVHITPAIPEPSTCMPMHAGGDGAASVAADEAASLSRGMQTLVVGVPSRLVGAEWVAVCRRCFQVLDGYLRDQVVSFGGGFTEVRLLSTPSGRDVSCYRVEESCRTL